MSRYTVSFTRTSTQAQEHEKKQENQELKKQLGFINDKKQEQYHGIVKVLLCW